MECGVTLAGVTLGLRRLAWLIEVRGLANRSEGFGGPGPVDKSEGFGWAGRAQGPSIKVRDLGGRAGPGLNCEIQSMGWRGLSMTQMTLARPIK